MSKGHCNKPGPAPPATRLELLTLLSVYFLSQPRPALPTALLAPSAEHFLAEAVICVFAVNQNPTIILVLCAVSRHQQYGKGSLPLRWLAAKTDALYENSLTKVKEMVKEVEKKAEELMKEDPAVIEKEYAALYRKYQGRRSFLQQMEKYRGFVGQLVLLFEEASGKYNVASLYELMFLGITHCVKVPPELKGFFDVLSKMRCDQNKAALDRARKFLGLKYDE